MDDGLEGLGIYIFPGGRCPPDPHIPWGLRPPKPPHLGAALSNPCIPGGLRLPDPAPERTDGRAETLPHPRPCLSLSPSLAPLLSPPRTTV